MTRPFITMMLNECTFVQYVAVTASLLCIHIQKNEKAKSHGHFRNDKIREE